jgi:hypothetical protein
VTQAFAAVASDQRPRGRAIFRFLVETLTTTQDPATRTVAAAALAMSNLPEAARELAQHYHTIREVRPQLGRMGDIAVPILAVFAQQGAVEALDDLQNIGTPQAARAFVPLLWHEDTTLTTQAAFHLGALMSQHAVENALRNYPLRDEYWKATWFEWVWEPFSEPIDSSLPIITGRIAYLIEQAIQKGDVKTAVKVDQRIIIPLAVRYGITRGQFIEFEIPDETEDTIISSFQMLGITINKNHHNKHYIRLIDIVNTLPDELLSHESSQRTLMKAACLTLIRIKAKSTAMLLELLDPKEMFVLLRSLVNITKPTLNDWRNIYRPITYNFEQSWHYRAILFLAGLISVFAVSEIVYNLSQSWNIISIQTFLIYIISGVWLLFGWFFIWKGIEGEFEGKFSPDALAAVGMAFIICIVTILVISLFSVLGIFIVPIYVVYSERKLNLKTITERYVASVRECLAIPTEFLKVMIFFAIYPCYCIFHNIINAEIH